MIVVMGVPSLRPAAEGTLADGLSSRIAIAAAAAGATVQLLGMVGEDRAGDTLLIDLARHGVGHAALLRDPVHPTPILQDPVVATGGDGRVFEADDLLDAAELLVELPPEPEAPAPAGDVAHRPRMEAADLDLGLRYLVEFRVLVATDPLDERAARVVAEAATFANAHIVALVTAGSDVPEELSGATVLESPSADPDGAFARFVAGYAVALDRGADTAAAFTAAAETGGWEAALS